MTTGLVQDLRTGYAALCDSLATQDISTLGAMKTSNNKLEDAVHKFKRKLRASLTELPSGASILTSEYDLLCQFSRLNGKLENKVLSCVRKVEGARVVEFDSGLMWGGADISPLAGLTALRALVLATGEMKGTRSLSGLKSLQKLRINFTRIDDLETLSELTWLKDLGLVSAGISNVELVSRMTELESLSVGRNEISDLRPLSSLRHLKSLRIEENPISDLGALSSLAELRTLNMSALRVSDLRGLGDLTGLRELQLDWVDSSVDSLEKNALRWEELDSLGNQTPDAVLQEYAAGIRELRYFGFEIGDFGPLLGLNGLQSLALGPGRRGTEESRCVAPLLKLARLTTATPGNKDRSHSAQSILHILRTRGSLCEAGEK